MSETPEEREERLERENRDLRAAQNRDSGWGLGDLLGLGVGGAIVAGILAIAAKVFLNGDNEGVKTFIRENLGFEGMMFADRVSGWLRNDLFSEEELRDYFVKEMTPEDAKALIQSQLGDSDVLFGNKTLDALLSTEQNRSITVALLQAEGFSFENPESFSIEIAKAALVRAATGNRLDKNDNLIAGLNESEISQADLEAYTKNILKALTEDIEGAPPQRRAGLIRQAKDWVTGLFSEDATDRSAEAFGQDPQLVGTFLQTYPDEALDLLRVMIDDEFLHAIIDNNKTDVINFINKLNPEQVNKLATALFAAMEEGEGSSQMLTETLIEIHRSNPGATEIFIGEIDSIDILPPTMRGTIEDIRNVQATLNQASNAVSEGLRDLQESAGDLFGNLPFLGNSQAQAAQAQGR